MEGPLDLQDVVATTLAWGESLLTIVFVDMAPPVGIGWANIMKLMTL